MRLLDAANLILARVGEHPVTSIAIKHPTLAVLLPEIELELKTMLLRGWWFNEYDYTAYPNSEGQINLGTECLSFVPKYVDAALRGQELYDTANRTYVWTAPVQGRIKEYLSFERVPETAAQHVLFMAAVNTYIQDIGKTNEVVEWQAKATTALDALLDEHLRNKRYNSKNTTAFQRIVSALRGYPRVGR